jgi:hypothetical protein
VEFLRRNQPQTCVVEGEEDEEEIETETEEVTYARYNNNKISTNCDRGVATGCNNIAGHSTTTVLVMRCG